MNAGPSRLCRNVLLVSALLTCAATALAATDAPAELRNRNAALQDRLANNAFQRTLTLDSSETADSVSGDIHAQVDTPYPALAAALHSPAQWCDLLILHLNIKYCRPATTGREAQLDVSIGKKYDQPLDEAYRVNFSFRVTADDPGYLQVRLDADAGPLGTRDYRIVLEAIPLAAGRSFLRLSYTYGYGTAGRLAMAIYLGTAGRDKLGFSITGTTADGRPHYVGGARGVAERNTMRYFLAIEAYLGALAAPPAGRLDKSLRDWHAATERYPRQLHELELDAYLAMKHREYRRQQATGLSAAAQ